MDPVNLLVLLFCSPAASLALLFNANPEPDTIHSSTGGGSSRRMSFYDRQMRNNLSHCSALPYL
ncbi:hypothetical protein Ciccas_004075 [Cichlidogyrus casuarinus]|uniref:Secreted protein n=1 Tax=Cichlidogyrus casuarinus TaxID=1844966 RepID=A0ABD2QD11_9PLAT